MIIAFSCDCGNVVLPALSFSPVQGMGKKWLNNWKMTGMDITEKMKLEKTNWLDMDLLPPARSVNIGVAVTGGIALCKMNKSAML